MIRLKQSLIVILITLIFTEILSTVLIKLSNKFQVFRIWSFTEQTESGRITLKKNHTSNIDDKWTIYTDENRFRTKSLIDDKNINTDKAKILFIGDSVPFGWGVNYENSISGILEKKLIKITLMNGSIPSFSLAQSVERFEKEFKEINNIRYIYLQIIDPAIQYNYMKGDWIESVNWSNIVYILDLKDKFLFKYNRVPIYGELNFVKIIQKIYLKYFFKGKHKDFKIRDKDSDSRFINHVNDELNKIYKLIDKNTIMILSPAVLNPKKNEDNHAVDLLNLQIKKFDEIKENVIYLDAINLLKGHNPDKIFIDNCCHLSKFGNKLIADEIYKIINQNNGI